MAMFHLYNPNSGEHFYTWNAAEIDSLVCAGWESEGRDWATSAGGDLAYCLHNPNAGLALIITF
ncbi:hypothetical protein [Pseudoscardovia suis]|uniref:hypothetical protein n=1 Tax=Pseudoscardovia suis TaxID=987063 RepID=UPI003F9B44B1